MTATRDRDTIKKILLHGGRYLGAALAGLLTYPIVARVLDADGLGVWALLGAAAFLLTLADLGLTTAVQRAAVTQDTPRAHRIVQLALAVLLMTLPVIGLAAYFLLLDLPDASPALRVDASRAAVVALMGGGLMALAGPFRGFALARGGIRLLANAKLMASVIQVTVIIVGFQLAQTLLVPAFGLLLAYLAELIVTVWAARKIDPQIPITPRIPRDRAEIRSAFRDGAAQLGINAAVTTALRVDLFVLVRVAPLATVATYGVAGRAIDMAYLMSKQATVALMPDLGNPAQRARAVRIGTGVFTSAIVSGMLALAIVGQPVLVAWVGDVAAGAVAQGVLGLLAAGAIVMSIYEIAGTMVMLSARSGWSCARPVLIGSGLNLALSVAGAPYYGVWAVAGSTVVGNLVTMVLMWRAARGILGWDLRRLAGGVGPAFASGAVAGTAAALLRPWAFDGLLASLASCAIVGLLGVAAGFGSMALTGVPVSRQDRGEAPRRTVERAATPRSVKASIGES